MCFQYKRVHLHTCIDVIGHYCTYVRTYVGHACMYVCTYVPVFCMYLICDTRFVVSCVCCMLIVYLQMTYVAEYFSTFELWSR